jgi:RNA polymerase sigma factor (TIGR02999 family)
LTVILRAVILDRMTEVTRILEAIEQGDRHAANQLLPLVYEELRRLAAQKLAREKPGQTLDATALVHEAYLRLVGSGDASALRERHWQGRTHFLAAAAEAMRHILVDNARRKRRARHGGGRQRVALDEAVPAPPTAANDLLALDEALTRLAAQDPEAAGVVQLRYFAGLSVEEAALSLDISRASAYRHWNFARAWLLQELSGETPA